jgi:hypothetical protein
MRGSAEAELAREQVVKESVLFRGHPMVRSLHPTTIEITTEEHLTPAGDCIIGVGANKGCTQLSRGVREALRKNGALVRIAVVVQGEEFSVSARGDPRLSLTDPRDMVIRRSEFVSDRTLALGASAAARDIPRSMVALLKDPGVEGRLEIEVG